MRKESCNCFTCRHKDEPRVVAGYLHGYIDASDWFINWAEKNKIKLGSIADDDLGGIYAQMKCNRDESGCLLGDFPDLENETSKMNEFVTNPEDYESIMSYSFEQTKEIYKENQRLKNELDKQIKDNRKLVKTLKVYANTEPYVLKEDDWGKQVLDIRKIAQDVLKEVEEI